MNVFECGYFPVQDLWLCCGINGHIDNAIHQTFSPVPVCISFLHVGSWFCHEDSYRIHYDNSCYRRTNG